MLTNQEIGTRLRTERERLGLKQEQVADKMGVAQPTISQIESGSRKIEAWELSKLARIYHRDFDYFLEEKMQETPAPIFIWRKQIAINPLMEQYFSQYCNNYEKLEKMIEKRMAKFSALLLDDEGRTNFISQPPEQIDQMASEYWKRLNLGGRPACILEEVLEEKLGIKLCYAENIGGSACATLTQTFGAGILLNSNNAPWRRNYDIAHELFHLITWDIFDPKDICGSPENGEKSKADQWADRFASAILMPTDEVNGEYNKMLQGNPIYLSDIVDLAIKFSVSTKALLWRLVNLGRIGRKKVEALLENPELVEIDQMKRAAIKEREKQYLSPRFISLAIRAFQQGKISRGKLAEYLGISYSAASEFLLAHGYDENKDYSDEFTAS
jgi:Zn-dependent peptidase ImmA (M78 family)/transcriptional regulator with XRE-family HTH domain